MEPFLFSKDIGGGTTAPVSPTMRLHHSAPSTTISPTPNLLTTREAMALLRIKTKNTLCTWVRQGKIKAIRMPDNSYRFEGADIDAWLLSRSTS